MALSARSKAIVNRIEGNLKANGARNIRHDHSNATLYISYSFPNSEKDTMIEVLKNGKGFALWHKTLDSVDIDIKSFERWSNTTRKGSQPSITQLWFGI
jgi:hypothetical protein